MVLFLPCTFTKGTLASRHRMLLEDSSWIASGSTQPFWSFTPFYFFFFLSPHRIKSHNLLKYTNHLYILFTEAYSFSGASQDRNVDMGLGCERSVFVFERGRRPGSPDSCQYRGQSKQEVYTWRP